MKNCFRAGSSDAAVILLLGSGGSNLKTNKSGVDTCKTVSYNGTIVFMR